jgi:hypothetical protein
VRRERTALALDMLRECRQGRVVRLLGRPIDAAAGLGAILKHSIVREPVPWHVHRILGAAAMARVEVVAPDAYADAIVVAIKNVTNAPRRGTAVSLDASQAILAIRVLVAIAFADTKDGIRGHVDVFWHDIGDLARQILARRRQRGWQRRRGWRRRSG